MSRFFGQVQKKEKDIFWHMMTVLTDNNNFLFISPNFIKERKNNSISAFL
jgi:hypothetical protein